MAFPIDIRFIGVEPSAALDAFVRDWAGKLEHVGPGIERCDVVIDRPHRHHRHGRRYEVRIALAGRPLQAFDVVWQVDAGRRVTGADHFERIAGDHALASSGGELASGPEW
jgi:hypothetical protein